MPVTNALFSKLMRVVTHLESQKDTLFAGHCVQDSRLHGCNLWLGIKGKHELILACQVGRNRTSPELYARLEIAGGLAPLRILPYLETFCGREPDLIERAGSSCRWGESPQGEIPREVEGS